MVKHTQTICQLLPTSSLSVFGHYVGLAPEKLTRFFQHPIQQFQSKIMKAYKKASWKASRAKLWKIVLKIDLIWF